MMGRARMVRRGAWERGALMRRRACDEGESECNRLIVCQTAEIPT
jgi:hypothetical protein